MSTTSPIEGVARAPMVRAGTGALGKLVRRRWRLEDGPAALEYARAASLSTALRAWRFGTTKKPGEPGFFIS